MADKLNSGDIFTNPVGNNLVVVDPNKIMGSNGKVIDRLVNAEDLVMYANLSARIYPRSKIIAGAAAGDEIKVELFEGELNFLKPGGKKFLDSDWTDGFTDPDFNKKKTRSGNGVEPAKFYDNSKDFGGFGITSISVKVNASYIPQVTINFTDIRGKTLFEQAKTNTPYTAFFHLPYPTFFLTLKGYYGKAVQYQLTLEKFVSRFDPGTGDYLITCDFKGNHIALLRDINMMQCVTAPYMYPTRVDSDGFTTSTKGRQIMSSVYGIYKKAKLIPQDFPEYTIVELIQKVKTIDNDLGKLYGEKNLTTTTDKLKYEESLDKFKEAFKENWVMKYLATDLGEDVEIVISAVDVQGNAYDKKVSTTAYPLKAIGDINKNQQSPTTQSLQEEEEKAKEALNQLVLQYENELNENNTFGEFGEYKVKNSIKPGPTLTLYADMKVNGVDGVTVDNTDKLLIAIEPWFVIGVAEFSFYGRWNKQKKDFTDLAKEMSTVVSAELNERLQNYIGFVPTIRNVFAVMLAGADTYLRLLDDVHTKAMRQSTNPKRLAVANESNDNAKNNTKANEVCYPWPQYYVVEEEGKCGITSAVLKYPGASDVINITESDNKVYWPEVEFVEEFVKSTIYRLSDYKFATLNSGLSKQFTPINVRDWPSRTTPYITKDNNEFLFEILDRAQAAITFGGTMTRYQALPAQSLIGESLNELAVYEAQNINKQIEENPQLQEFIGSLSSFEDIERKLKSTSPYNFKVYESFGIVTPFTQKTFTIETRPNNPFEIVSKNFSLNSEAIKVAKTTGFFDVVPIIYTNVDSWVTSNFAGGKLISSPGDFYSINDSLVYDTNASGVLRDNTDFGYLTSMFIGMRLEGMTWVDYYTNSGPSGPQTDINVVNQYYETRMSTSFDGMFLDYTEGDIKDSLTPINLTDPNNSFNQEIDQTSKKLASMLNTPYFINSLLDGVNKDKAGTANPYTLSSYLLLNSLPLINFRERVFSMRTNISGKFGDYVASMFNQMPALHSVPIPLLLKIGSIWWRYKETVKTTIDPLTPIWGDIGMAPSTIYDPANSSLNTNFTFTGLTDGTSYNYISEDTTNNSLQVGVYPSLIEAIQYIATDTTNSYVPPAPLSSLNLIFNPLTLPAVDLNLSIENNVQVSYTSSDGTKVKYYTVYLDSNNINDKSTFGVKFGNNVEPGRYFIIYPSAGHLTWTEAPAYADDGTINPATAPNNTNSMHNGAARLLWASSPNGYFQHKSSYQPAYNQYIKLVNPEKNEQFIPWSLIENTSYSTIEELRGVFNNQQLDEFEKMFLAFADLKNPKNVGGTLKGLIKGISVIEDTYFDTDESETVTQGFDIASTILVVQARKFSELVSEFINTKIDYSHNSTTNLDMIVNGSTVLQNLMGLYSKSTDYDFGIYPQSSVTIPTTVGGTFPPLTQEHIDMQIYVGEHYASGNDFDLLSTTDISNPFYNFFITAREDGNGIAFDSSNIEAFAPIIRMYGTYCVKAPALNTFPAHKYLKLLVDELEELNTKEEGYVNAILKETKKKIKATKNLNKLKEPKVRPEVEANDLKLELYNSFKTMNDRWVSGINLTATGGTLFERFLFLDRANRDIGSDAIINIWDILQLDSPFDGGSSKTLTQSIASYLSIILADNYFNFIPLPSYINFFNVEGDNSQRQGNAMFGTFTTVDYLDSKPAFLCQYVGNSSSQLDVKTPNNGYSTDTFNANNTANNPLLAEECGDRNLSNKVMGFNVDFGIPNQNIFESITLDQSQYQNTAESYKVLQEMANSGGGGATSMASLSLYNVYASRSYTAKITCMGNVTIQPTMYFQLRYLPMFNGPYLIINVEHDIRPNTIETSFEGIRVPIPKLPKIDDLVQRVNESLYKEAETNLRGTRQPNYFYDNLNATTKQMKLTPEDNGYIDSGSTSFSPHIIDDAIVWGTVMFPGHVSISEDNPLEPHLGIDLTPVIDMTEEASSETGLYVYPAFDGVVTAVIDGCSVGNTDEHCAKGNVVEITHDMGVVNPVDDETVYYKIIYAFLREGILVTPNQGPESIIYKSSVGRMDINLPGSMTGKKLGKLGNTGNSKGQHLHFEIIRGVQVKGKVVEHILNPKNFLPEYQQN
tara:strand:+ start:8014 stop:14316 length:6303 start_codon:yes stop_codon:yes gene_type:complete